MSTHRDFAQALLAPEAPSPASTRDPCGGAAGVRFDVYRNNVTVSLIEAMWKSEIKGPSGPVWK